MATSVSDLPPGFVLDAQADMPPGFVTDSAPGLPAGFVLDAPAPVHGTAPLRDKLFPGEDDYFKKNPHVAGMAAEDNRVILNPYSTLSAAEKAAVVSNEHARIVMRTSDDRPGFTLTPEQQARFGGYSTNPQDVRETLAARLFSGDPSAGAATPEQGAYVERLRRRMQGGPAAPAEQFGPPAPKPLTPGMDVLNQIPPGLIIGATEFVGLPVTLDRLANGAAGWLADKTVAGGRYLAGMPQETPEEKAAFDKFRDEKAAFGIPGKIYAAQDAVRQGLRNAFPKPQTTPGKYTRTIMENAPSAALGPGGAFQKFMAGAVAPGVASEGLGQFFEGSSLETPARFVGDLLGNVGGALVQSRSAGALPEVINQATDNIRPKVPAGVNPYSAQARAAGNASSDAFRTAQELTDMAWAQFGIRLSPAEALDYVSGNATGLGPLERLAMNSQAGGVIREWLTQRGAAARTALTNTLDNLGTNVAAPARLGTEAANVARQAIDADPAVLASLGLVDTASRGLDSAVTAAGPRVTADQAGQVIQNGLVGVRDGREGVRSALANADYTAARQAPPTIPVANLGTAQPAPVTTHILEPSQPSQLQPSPAMTATPVTKQAPAIPLESATGPAMIQADPRDAINLIDSMGAVPGLERVRAAIFPNGQAASTAVGDLDNAYRLAGDLMDTAHGADAAALGRVKGALETALSASPEWVAARNNYAAASRPLDPFANTPALDSITKRDEFGTRLTLPPERVPGTLLSGSPVANLQAFSQVAGPAERAALADRMTTQWLDEATDALTGAVDAGKLAQTLRANADVISQVPEVGTRLESVLNARQGVSTAEDAAAGVRAQQAQGLLGNIERSGTTNEIGSSILPTQPHWGQEGEIGNAVKAMADIDPTTTQNLVRQVLLDRYIGATPPMGAEFSRPAKYAASLAGEGQRAANLGAVLDNLPTGQQTAGELNQLLNVFRATGTRREIGSNTTFNEMIRGQLGQQTSPQNLFNKAFIGGIPVPQAWRDAADRAWLGKNVESLAHLFTSPEGLQKIHNFAQTRGPTAGLSALARTFMQAPLQE